MWKIQSFKVCEFFIIFQVMIRKSDAVRDTKVYEIHKLQMLIFQKVHTIFCNQTSQM
jgi:hypothetical protein